MTLIVAFELGYSVFVFAAVLDNGDSFGISLAALADLNGDAVADLAAGASQDDDGGTDRGAVYVLYMASTGLCKSFQKLSDTKGAFTGVHFHICQKIATPHSRQMCCIVTH